MGTSGNQPPKRTCPACGAALPASTRSASGRCPSCKARITKRKAAETASDSGDLAATTALPTPTSKKTPSRTSPDPRSATHRMRNSDPALGGNAQTLPLADGNAQTLPLRDGNATPADTGTANLEAATLPLPASSSPPPREAVDQLWAETLQGIGDENVTLKAPAPLRDRRPAPHPTPSGTVTVKPRQLQDAEVRHAETDFALLSVLGEGGMGVVYSATQTAFDRSVALKMIKGHAATSEEHRRKFLAEAAVTGELEHPNIIPVHDLGLTQDGKIFYAMKHVKGKPWDKAIQTLPLPENLDILMRVSDAVAFAHSRQIIHRDLKPENIMLGEFGEVIVMDWGLAASLTESGKAESILDAGVGGTPAYMAPEMAGGDNERIGPRSDVYLLGGILYEIVTGLRPHTGGNVMECLFHAATNVIQPSPKRDELVEIALHAMEADPEDRFASVAAFQQALREYQSHKESLALSASASSHLEQAKESSLYEDYARALFGFEEALRLWDRNRAAEKGLVETRLAYARTALEKGDLDLAHSLLPERQAAFKSLAHEIGEAIRRKTARQRNFRILAVGSVVLVLTIFAGVSVGFFWIRHERDLAESARLQAEDAREFAEVKKHEAEESRRFAQEQRDQAIEARALAELMETQAVEAAVQLEEAMRSVLEAETGVAQASAREEAAKLLAGQAMQQLQTNRELLANEWWILDAEEAKQRQIETATTRNWPTEQSIHLPGDISIQLSLIPAGLFGMGSPATQPRRLGEEQLHRAEIRNPYYMAQTELTLAQWIAAVGSPPPLRQSDAAMANPEAYPVVGLSWQDLKTTLLPKMQPFAPKGFVFRLPTEAQWEYAARAGTNTPFHTGRGEESLDRAGWYRGNSAGRLQPVAQKSPNAWGVYDMHGNVAEWCRDFYRIDAYMRPDAEVTVPADGHRVVRGGSGIHAWYHCRSAYRSEAHPANRYEFLGARLILEAEGD